MRINYVRAHRAIRETCRRLELEPDYKDMLESLFEMLNERGFPEGAFTVGNAKMIYYMGLKGVKADRRLRQIRQALVELGLIRVTPGSHGNSEPRYEIVWDAFGVETESSTKDGAGDTAGDKAGDNFVPRNGGRPDNNISPYLERDKQKRKQRERRRAAPPTLDEVRAYAEEIGFAVNPLKFCDYYATRGWKIDDWRAAMRSWQHREGDFAAPPRRVTAQCYTQRSYTEAELDARVDGL